MVYVRSSSKDHGLENLVEGVVKKGQKTIVIEDLVSTGQSSIKAVNALREQGCDVQAMLAIFTYGFNKAVEGFKNINCPLQTLTNYNSLIEIASQTGYVQQNQQQTLLEWRKNPDTWGK